MKKKVNKVSSPNFRSGKLIPPSRNQIPTQLHPEPRLLNPTMTPKAREIRTPTRRRKQRIEIESAARLSGREGSFGDIRRATAAPGALGGTGGDVDEVGEVELLAGGAEAGQEAGSAGGGHHGRGQRGVVGGRGGGGHDAGAHDGVGGGGRRGEVEEKVGALFADGGVAADEGVGFAWAGISGSVRRWGAGRGGAGEGGAELEGVQGEFLVFAVRADAVGGGVGDG